MRLPSLLPVLAALALVACGGGSSDPAAPAFTAQFTGSGTPAAANLVRMTPAVVDRDLVRINELDWTRVDRSDELGTTPRSARSWPLRRLPVLSHRS